MAACPVLAAQPQLNANTDLATAGYFQLSWEANVQSAPYVLQQSLTPSFSNSTTIYVGTDTASVRSGLSNGTYHFRLLDGEGMPSNIVTVQVAHHSLTKAFSFFALGVLMFVILVAVLVSASRGEEAA